MQCTCTVSYCHLWPVSLYNIYILSHSLIKKARFSGKNYWTKNASPGFLYKFVWNFPLLREPSPILPHTIIKTGTVSHTQLVHIQGVQLATEPGVSLIILILSGRKWWPLPAHVIISSNFLHNEVSPLQISLQYPHYW
jgi:hypothetical protein